MTSRSETPRERQVREALKEWRFHEDTRTELALIVRAKLEAIEDQSFERAAGLRDSERSLTRFLNRQFPGMYDDDAMDGAAMDRECVECGYNFRTVRPSSGSRWDNLCPSCLADHL